MFEYIFFDAGIRDKFVQHASTIGVSCTFHDDHMGLVVAIPENIDEENEISLEQLYDELEKEQITLLQNVEGGFNRLAGINFSLPDGQSRMVPLQTEIANRLLATFTMEEIQELFETVAVSMIGQEEHLCKILANQTRKN
jgi:hypothetical protein